jgi:DNA invertase Pin-like site-specific DNA recombinase
MANALVVHRDRLPQSQKTLRAAQYVRMSTDYQQYSIENQAVVIGAYAQLHKLSIVRTYRDEGESGLKIKNRKGLTQLIDDVQSGQADFGHILVFDVSRWGRFQDVDESAHYEFICKQAGIRVAYCAEQFDNDGSLISHIVKNIKRVMAAEYSRELSAKVHAGQSRYAGLGFKMGGAVAYGLMRVLVDEKSQPKRVLGAGERKCLTTEHVRIHPGPANEVAIAKRIFQEFLQGKTERTIARELNARGVLTHHGRPWNRAFIGSILKNEAYIGNLLYNRSSKKLGSKRIHNPASVWIRSEGCVEPIIDRDVFLRAQKIMRERRVDISEEEMLIRLRKFLMKTGKLRASIIEQTVGLPSYRTLWVHFGSIRNVYRLIGYTGSPYWDRVEANNRWRELNTRNAALLRERFKKLGYQTSFDPMTESVRVKDVVSICFRLAYWTRGKCESHSTRWSLRRRLDSPEGWVVAIRLGKQNKDVLDYVLLSSTSFFGVWVRFSERQRNALRIERFESFDNLARSLVRRVSKPPASTPLKRQRPKMIVSGSRSGGRSRANQQ